ncbi:MAG: YjbH domain-containing protein [Muribaculaceae bacterium]|nr:YjbH domain-containing protein [Muribaculaceae bacterium]
MKLRLAAAAVALYVAAMGVSATAQQYTGMSGMINVPSAEMDSAGDARLGAHFLNRNSLPTGAFKNERGTYHTYDFYISLTPFWWVELGYTITLFKDKDPEGHLGYHSKDRYMSIKFNPLREGKWWPAVAVGSNDFISSSFNISTEDSNKGNSYFRNYYAAATKHFSGRWGEAGITAVYRHFTNLKAHKWNGVVGGVTYRPPFARNLRAIVEWTGCDVNVGVDCLLCRHLLIQGSLQGGRYPSAGLCYVVNLF